jgi:hypothetical protein
MREFHILNLGAGVQSTALYLMSLRRDEPEFVPVFDYAIFADTQDEPKAVYVHLEWLKSLGGPPILEDSVGRLGDDLSLGVNSTGQRFAPIPAYTKGEGDLREGQLRRQCTKEYKIAVVERVIRRRLLGLSPGQHIPKDVMIHQYMGLSFDEPGRIVAVQGRFGAIRWSRPHFPLFDLEMSRAGCVLYLEAAASGRKVPRSACVFCPYRSNAEWRAMRDGDPSSWLRAVEVDDSLRRPGSVVNRGMDKPLFVHRSCKPLRDANIESPESRGEQYQFGFARECEGMCGG